MKKLLTLSLLALALTAGASPTADAGECRVNKRGCGDWPEGVTRYGAIAFSREGITAISMGHLSATAAERGGLSKCGQADCWIDRRFTARCAAIASVEVQDDWAFGVGTDESMAGAVAEARAACRRKFRETAAGRGQADEAQAQGDEAQGDEPAYDPDPNPYYQTFLEAQGRGEGQGQADEAQGDEPAYDPDPNPYLKILREGNNRDQDIFQRHSEVYTRLEKKRVAEAEEELLKQKQAEEELLKQKQAEEKANNRAKWKKEISAREQASWRKYLEEQERKWQLTDVEQRELKRLRIADLTKKWEQEDKQARERGEADIFQQMSALYGNTILTPERQKQLQQAEDGHVPNPYYEQFLEAQARERAELTSPDYWQKREKERQKREATRGARKSEREKQRKARELEDQQAELKIQQLGQKALRQWREVRAAFQEEAQELTQEPARVKRMMRAFDANDPRAWEMLKQLRHEHEQEKLKQKQYQQTSGSGPSGVRKRGLTLCEEKPSCGQCPGGDGPYCGAK